ncbi:MAG: hypothetical protein Q8P28_05820 [Deltaproteobacteria bacterium]|nr:hypothetical protein [Deltaproteobacteria bacterium]
MIQKLQKHRKAIFYIALLVIAVLAGIVSWVSFKDSANSGLGLISLDNTGQIWVQVNDEFYILGEDGKIIRQLTANQMGIQPPFAGIAALPNGDMLIGSQESAKIHFIHVDGSLGAVIDLHATGAGKPFRLFHLAYYPEKDAILLTDTSNHRIIMLSRDGTLLSRSVPGIFHFPNDIVVDAAGRIIVADTNNHDIKVLHPSLTIETTWNPLASALYSNSPYRFQWPVHLAIDNSGNTYVTNHDNNLEFAEIVKLNQQGKRESLIPLLNRAQPVAIVAGKNDLLFTDHFNFQIRRLDLLKNSFSRFGSPEFQNVLDTLKLRHKTYEMTILTGQVLLGVILFALFIILAAVRRTEYNRPIKATVKTDSLVERPSLFLRLELALLTTSILLFRLTVRIVAWLILISTVGLILQLILISTVVPISKPYTRASPIIIWVALWILLLGIFLIAILITLMFSAAGSFILARGSRRGRYHPVFHYYARRLMSKHAEIIEKLAEGETVIKHYSTAIIDGYQALVLLIENKMFVVTLSRFENIAHRIQEIDCTCLKSTTLIEKKTLSGKLWPMDYPITYFIFKTSEDGTPYNLNLIDYIAAKELCNEISKCNIIKTPTLPAFIDRCTTCGKILESAGCTVCEVSKINLWKPAILSMLLPGM